MYHTIPRRDIRSSRSVTTLLVMAVIVFATARRESRPSAAGLDRLSIALLIFIATLLIGIL